MRSIAYDMRGFFQQVVDKYVQFSCKKETDLKSVQTPSIDDHQIPPEDFESKGALSNDAARIVMKALYGVRFVKYNLLWPICNLAFGPQNILLVHSGRSQVSPLHILRASYP